MLGQKKRRLLDRKVFKHVHLEAESSLDRAMLKGKGFKIKCKPRSTTLPHRLAPRSLAPNPPQRPGPLSKLDFDLEDKHPIQKLRYHPHLQNLCTARGRGALLGPGQSWLSF